MIIAITGIVHKYDLLPYYLAHYRELGAARFAIACDPAALDPSGELAEFLGNAPDVQVVNLSRGFKRSSIVGMIEEETRRLVAGADDWIIPADLDELNQYPDDLPELIEKMVAANATHVTGVFRDRLAPGGELAAPLPFGAGVSLWDQYPLEAEVTKLITKGWTDKVLLSRGDLELSFGHHHMRESDQLRPYPETGIAHHFKWRDNLERMLDWRIENEQRLRMPWSDESVRLGEYLSTHGRIRLEDVRALPGWSPAGARAG